MEVCKASSTSILELRHESFKQLNELRQEAATNQQTMQAQLTAMNIMIQQLVQSFHSTSQSDSTHYDSPSDGTNSVSMSVTSHPDGFTTFSPPVTPTDTPSSTPISTPSGTPQAISTESPINPSLTSLSLACQQPCPYSPLPTEPSQSVSSPEKKKLRQSPPKSNDQDRVQYKDPSAPDDAYK